MAAEHILDRWPLQISSCIAAQRREQHGQLCHRRHAPCRRKTGRRLILLSRSGIIRHPVIPARRLTRGLISFYDITEAVGWDAARRQPWLFTEPASGRVLRMLEISAIASQYMGDALLQVSTVLGITRRGLCSSESRADLPSQHQGGDRRNAIPAAAANRCR